MLRCGRVNTGPDLMQCVGGLKEWSRDANDTQLVLLVADLPRFVALVYGCSGN